MIFDNQGIIGCDISYGQGYPPRFPVVDFRKMRDYGFDFVIMKAGQRHYQDPAFKYNWPAAKGILSRGSYWYYDNTYSPFLQADNYWRTIRNDVEGICWLDLEDRNSGNARGWRHWYDFLETFKTLSKLSNAQIGIYSAYWYIREELLNASWSEREYFRRYPLWLADYGPHGSDPLHRDFSKVSVPMPWSDDDCLIVQTGTPVIGESAGVYSLELDYNVFNGSREKFRTVFKPVADMTISIRSN